MKTSPFYAYLSRLRWIKRWGLMRNAYSENVMEHSWEVASIAHILALIKNYYYKGDIDANAVATAALYHDVSEVITSDLPTPIKYHSKAIEQAFKAIEHQAAKELLNLLPSALQAEFQTFLCPEQQLPEIQDLIKIADKIAAYLKCQAELKANNQEFKNAADTLLDKIQQSDLPEVHYFMAVFAPDCGLSLDGLMKVKDEFE